MPDQPSSSLHTQQNIPYPAASTAWRATIILSVLYWLSILDRFIIALLVDPIKADLAISDFQFSLLHGMAFTVTYAVVGLFAGVLADKFSRRWIICISVSVWSLATAACGVAQNFWQLLIARFGVGTGEAGLNPSATSILTDLFPRDRLTSAMAVYTVGASVGSGMAYLCGGYIVDWITTQPTFSLPLVGELRSWQAVFLIIGIPGALLSLLVFTFPEPLRRNRIGQEHGKTFWSNMTGSFRDLFKFISPRRSMYTYIYIGFGLGMLIMASGAIWYPAHMSRAFGWSASQIGLYLGLTLIISSGLGKILGGLAMDALFRRGVKDAQMRWFGTCLLISLPFGLIATTSTDPWIFLICIGVFFTLLAPLPACYNTTLNMVTPNELRGTGIAFFAATVGMVGNAAGPIMVASFSDYVYGDAASVGKSLATVFILFCPLASAALFMGCRYMRDGVKEAEMW